MSKYLATDGKNGSINKIYTNKKDDQLKTIEFNSGDLKFGVHGTYTTAVKGSQNKDGTWDLNVSITDVYDYEYKNYNGNPAVTGVNNAATYSQNKGVISNFGITFALNISHYNPKKKK
jgi:hypothetical protein